MVSSKKPHQMIQRHKCGERDAIGNNEKERKKPTPRSAEHDVAETKNPAAIEIARLVDAVERARQAAVRAEGRFAAKKAPRPGAVGLLEIIPRNSVADLA